MWKVTKRVGRNLNLLLMSSYGFLMILGGKRVGLILLEVVKKEVVSCSIWLPIDHW